MTLATTYPLLDLFWTLLMFVGLVLWIWLLIFLIFDIFRSPELSGWAKAGWLLLLVVLPLVGVIAYIVARGGRMRDHVAEDLGGGPPMMLA